MSAMPNSVPSMARATRNGSQERETFHKFFECWLSEQNDNLHTLVSASKQHEEVNSGHNGRNEHEEQVEERVLCPLLDREIKHYENYYSAKSRWAMEDVLSMFNPSWRSSLEDAFMWIGGWRPSMAFHLLYSKSGMQLEARLMELMQGLSTGDLGDLSPMQLNQVNELQKQTIEEEKEISEKLAKQQESVADTSMVELSHVVTELMREGEVEQAMDNERVEAALAPKEEGLVEILQKADNLRLDTLKKVLRILTPIQGVHFLIAAAELHLRVHQWGEKKDANHPRAAHAHPQ